VVFLLGLGIAISSATPMPVRTLQNSRLRTA
jgi:hypothetical protein